MEAYFENLTLKQKLIFLAGVCGFIFLLFFISFLLSSHKKQQLQSSKVLSNSPTISLIPSQPAEKIPPKIYNENGIKFQYPGIWDYYSFQNTNGETDITVISQNTQEEFYLKIMPEKNGLYESLASLYPARLFANSTLIIDGQQAQEYKAHLDSTIDLLTRNHTTIYLSRFSYQRGQENAAYKNYQQIRASFHFTKP